jgi:hypothetical protein
VKWVIQGCKTVLPTRIACYDLQAKKCVREIDLEQYGLNAVYSIVDGSICELADSLQLRSESLVSVEARVALA